MSSMDDLLALVRNKRADIKASSGGFQNAQKLPTGKSRWRILPGWDATNRNNFSHDFGQHYVKDKDGSVKGVYVCEAETFGRTCTICNLLDDSKRSTRDDGVLNLLKEMDARKVYIVNALRMDGAGADPKKPVLLQLPKSAMEQYLGLVEERAGDEINILSMEEGRDVIINKEGAGLTTKYNVNDAPRNTAVDESVLTDLVNLDEWIDKELRRGIAKGIAIAEGTVRAVASMPASPASIATSLAMTSPSPVGPLMLGSGSGSATAMMASLVPNPRVIEVEEEPVTTTVASKTATSVIDNDDLDALLKELD